MNYSINPVPGDRIEALAVTDLTVEGLGVARYGNRVVFLEGALPGSLVAATVSRVRKGIVHATMDAVLEESPHARPPWCPHYFECGGCNLQHFALAATLDWKRNHVHESLARIGKLRDLEVLAVCPSPLDRGYRNKMTYALGRNSEGGTCVGLRKAGEHTIVEVDQCGLQSDLGMAILGFFRDQVRMLGLQAWQARDSCRSHGGARGGYLRHCVIHTPCMKQTGDLPQTLVECISTNGHDLPAGGGRSNIEALNLLGQSLYERFGCAFVHSERKDPADLAQGETTVSVIGAGAYRETFGHLVVTVPYNAFLQTNTKAAERLYALVLKEADIRADDVLWDIYCGIGTFGLFTGNGARAVHGFEVQNDAVTAARANAADLGFSHCFFHQGDVADTLGRQDIPKPNILVADPPRAGLSGPVIHSLLGLPARRFVYISCNVATQARDAAVLAPVWKAVKSLPVDMFPHTTHVENILVFERRV